MNLAVMQPYLFPYIGYFQLICASDLFLLYDDVSYIKQSYINRNSILMNGQLLRFTVPVPGASSNKTINQLSYSKDVRKVIETISQSYSKAPYYGETFPMISEILKDEERSISDLCLKSYSMIFSYLDLKKKFLKTSDLVYKRDLPAEDRIIELCKKFEADCYINSHGGAFLYSKENFMDADINLLFLKPEFHAYKQMSREFVPGLSIIDCLMNCAPSEVRFLFSKYELV
ncbi:MAG: WbqC family protein [Desulfuromonadales bacterium]|jgi:hypothetical protein